MNILDVARSRVTRDGFERKGFSRTRWKQEAVDDIVDYMRSDSRFNEGTSSSDSTANLSFMFYPYNDHHLPKHERSKEHWVVDSDIVYLFVKLKEWEWVHYTPQHRS